MDLAAFHPRVKSVAIVPLGLTRYNTDKRLTAVTPEFCRRTITEVNRMQKELRRRLGTRFAFLGDEIFLRGGRAVPGRAHYGNYPQIEDGVGMVRTFSNQFQGLMRKLETHPPARPQALSGTIMTGTLFAPVLRGMIEDLNQRWGTRISVVAVENLYFGGDVSVAGLVTGGDLLAAHAEISGDFVIIPRTMLKSDEDVMLDGLKLEEIESQLGLPVQALDFNSFSHLITGASNHQALAGDDLHLASLAAN
jgi:NifB/MoaA-like Fe-S oxidoreductase